jgi:putative hydrolase of the HAD superfamily
VRIEALLLDLDNTLVDRDAAFERAVSAWFPAADLPALRRLDARGRTPRADFCAQVVRRWPGRWEDGGALWEDLRPAIAGAVRPDPEVLDAMQRLAERYRMAVVSNGGGDNQRRKLARAGLARFRFEAVLISGEVGFAKPDPRIFRAALGALGLPPGAALMVGDDPERDIAGAAALGIQTLWVGDSPGAGGAALRGLVG